MSNEHDTTVQVLEHIILRNGWEYYILEREEAGGGMVGPNWFALVVGDYTEMGNVFMPEIEPYIISRTTQLDEILPPPRWRWSDGAFE
jgi:hypothetical protein